MLGGPEKGCVTLGCVEGLIKPCCSLPTVWAEYGAGSQEERGVLQDTGFCRRHSHHFSSDLGGVTPVSQTEIPHSTPAVVVMKAQSQPQKM